MLNRLGVRGVACPRCDTVSQDQGKYCRACGMSLGTPHPLLRNNRWMPQDDEMAVFFGIDQLSGVFRKAVMVPPAARAYILQGNNATEVPQGEYELEGFFSRLNHLLRDRPAEILITREAPFALSFALTGIPSAECLPLDVNCTLAIQIESCTHFARYFMQTPGVITTTQVQSLLQPLLKQTLQAFLGARSLADLAQNAVLCEQLNEYVHSALKLRLAHFGLALVQLDTIRLCHQQWDANRARQASLSLILDAKKVEQDHAAQLAQLYTAGQWADIERHAEQQRQQLKRAQLAREQREARASLVLDEREQIQTLRAREIELYGRIVEAQSRKHALERGAQATVMQLEHELTEKRIEHQTEQDAWQQVRALAQIKLRTELELAQIDSKESLLLAQQQLEQQVASWQRQQQLAQIEQIGDEQARRLELARVRAEHEQAARHQLQIQEQQQQARLQEVNLARAARTREAERVQAWQDELAQQRQRQLLREDALHDSEQQLQVQAVQQKIDDLRRTGATHDAIAQQEKLLGTIKAQAALAEQERQARRALAEDALEEEERRSLLQQQEQEAAWQRTLRQEEQVHQQRLARFAALDQVSDLSKVALADLPNANLVADILKTRIQTGMSAEQIAASTGLQAHRAASEASALALQQERQYQATRSEDERRHVRDMIEATRGPGVQSGIESGHLAGAGQRSASSQPDNAGMAAEMVAVPLAQVMKSCRMGHLNLPHAKYCTECGTPLV